MERMCALVTGSSRGIGRGIAVELARVGARVAVNYVANVEAAADLAYFACDVSDRGDRERLIDSVVDRFGGLDALVNNAGRAPRVRADLLEAGEESFEELLRTNLQGPYFLTQRAAPLLVARARQRPATHVSIVFVTSCSAEMASPNRGEYCVSKAGLAMASRLWAVRLAEFGIPVYEVRPGIIRTDMTAGVADKYDRLIGEGVVPQGRWGTPEDVGRIVAALARGDAPYSTGAVVVVDGGLTIPRL